MQRLGIDTTIDALAAGASTTVTSAQIPALLAAGHCSSLYRLTVTNTGTVDLENVVVNDPSLGIANFPVVDLLLIGETVVLNKVDIAALFQQGRCTVGGSVVNMASASGTSVEFPSGSVNDDDSATLVCEEQLDICVDGGAPSILKVRYDGDSDTSHMQGNLAKIVPPNVVFPAEPVYIEVTLLRGQQPLILQQPNVAIGESFDVSDGGGKLNPALRFEIFTAPDGTLLQTVEFHTSCSVPLKTGDEYGAITIVGEPTDALATSTKPKSSANSKDRN